TVMTAQRTFSGPWASCCLCVAVMCEPKVAVSGSSSLYFKMRQGQTADLHIVLGTEYSVLGTARARIRTTSLMSLPTLRRCRKRAFLALATALIISRAASADIFILESGGRVEGEWLNREEQPLTAYAVLSN